MDRGALWRKFSQLVSTRMTLDWLNYVCTLTLNTFFEAHEEINYYLFNYALSYVIGTFGARYCDR